MRYIATIFFLILVISVNSSAQEKEFLLWNNKHCAVVLTYDDGLNVHLDKVIPALDSLGFKATFYVPGRSRSLEARVKDWREIANNGHELGNHTLFHPCYGKSKGNNWVKPEYDLDNYSITRIVDEINVANTLLNAVDNKTKRTLAYSCGEKTANGKSFTGFISNDFVGARGVTSGLNKVNETDLFDINAFVVHDESGEELIDMVRNAPKEYGLIVFVFHGVGGEHAINIPLADHNKLLHYLKENEDTVWVAPMVEIADYLEQIND